MATRWDEDNVRPQCVSCNIYSQGEQWLFGRHLDREQQGRAATVMRRAHEPRKFTALELEQLAEHYKNAWQEMGAHKRLVQRRSNPGSPPEGGEITIV
jgi:hypothetical protein